MKTIFMTSVAKLQTFFENTICKSQFFSVTLQMKL